VTRKHFVALARIIALNWRAADSWEARFAVQAMASDVASYLASQNPRFDRERFLSAAMPARD
jgi:hypothetical protein